MTAAPEADGAAALDYIDVEADANPQGSAQAINSTRDHFFLQVAVGVSRQDIRK